ncbi:MAG: LolA-related protein [Steroidobacterales bacterium]
MRRLLGATLAAALFGQAQGAAQDLDALMARLAQRQHGHVAFIETKYLAILDRPVQSAGELFYDAPDRLEKRTTTPRRESLLLEHGTLRMSVGRRERRLALQDYPQIAPLIDSMRATLAGDRAALERNFTVEFTGTLEHWRLLLAPRDATLRQVVREIRIDGEQDRLASIEIAQPDGDHSVMTLTAAEP